MPWHLRQATCNEGFKDYAFRDACRTIRRIGYEGIEIAPFTLAEDPAQVPAEARRAYRSIMGDEGLRFVGLHWLMVSPRGLHVTTPDAALRERSWRHIHHLIDLCADLGPDGIMVFGSPNQRATTGGLSPAEATRHFMDGLAGVAPHAEERGVTILAEALPIGQCNVMTTLDEAAAIVREIGSPAIQTMFDVHNAVDEIESHTILIQKHFDIIRHVHVNELDGRHPGTGSYNFKPILRLLMQRRFPGWISLEAFDFSPGPEVVARESLQFLEDACASML